MFTSNATYNSLLEKYERRDADFHSLHESYKKLKDEMDKLRKDLEGARKSSYMRGEYNKELQEKEKILEAANSDFKLQITTLQDKVNKLIDAKKHLLEMNIEHERLHKEAKDALEQQRKETEQAMEYRKRDEMKTARELTKAMEKIKAYEAEMKSSEVKRKELYDKNSDLSMQLAASRGREIALMDGVKKLEERNEVLEQREKRRREWVEGEKEKQKKLRDDAAHWAKVNAFMTNPNKYAIGDMDTEAPEEPEKLIEPMDEDEA